MCCRSHSTSKRRSIEMEHMACSYILHACIYQKELGPIWDVNYTYGSIDCFHDRFVPPPASPKTGVRAQQTHCLSLSLQTYIQQLMTQSKSPNKIRSQPEHSLEISCVPHVSKPQQHDSPIYMVRRDYIPCKI